MFESEGQDRIADFGTCRLFIFAHMFELRSVILPANVPMQLLFVPDEWCPVEGCRGGLPNISFGNACTCWHTDWHVPDTPIPRPRFGFIISESRGATLHVDVLLSFATTCCWRRAFGPLWHEPLCSTFVCAFVGFLCRVWGRSEVGRDSHLVKTCLLLFYTDHVPAYEEQACSARS
jgi:hypothetical protein